MQGFTTLGFRVPLRLMILKVHRGFKVPGCEYASSFFGLGFRVQA